MSFSVDQFMQVKCKFQLISEPEFSDSIHTNSERVRLCTSVDLSVNSTLIVMICSNETTNNHIVAYYTECESSTKTISSPIIPSDETKPFFVNYGSNDQRKPPQLLFDQPMIVPNQQQSSELPQPANTNSLSEAPKSKVIVKQIYYHYYNEDIAAVCLSDTGNKLALISASSTIYILPIKKIILNLHTKQSKTQENVQCSYDAILLNCCTIDNPVAIAYWENLEANNKSTLVVASELGDLSFISVDEKKELSRSNLNEKISSMVIVRDRFSHSVLITCASFKQYRFALEIVESDDSGVETTQTFSNPINNQINSDEYIYLEKDLLPSWNRKPIPIRLHNSSLSNPNSGTNTNIRRALLGRAGNQIGRIFNGLTSRERNTPSIFYHPASSMFSVVDTLGISQKSPHTTNHRQTGEQRLLRFFSTKQFYYRPQKPILICSLTSLEPDESITHVVLTDRFLAIATDRDRCLINSKNCCNMRNSDTLLELDPLVKEVTFGNDETILLLLKSPVSNDKNNIIDSFLLVTNKSIYSIEARQSSRDMFINLIDTHLHLKETRIKRNKPEDMVSCGFNKHEYALVDSYKAERKNSDTNLMIRSFLSHRDEVYERINYDSRAFSALFKLELNSLYEAYGDKLLMRGQFELANRFFQMAKFGHTKTLGKYIRLGAYKKTIDYINSVLRDENESLNERERADLAKVAYECLGYITSPEITRALVKDLSLTSECLGKMDLSNARKYSCAALRQFESFRKLVNCQHQKQKQANGLSFDFFESENKIFTEQQKRSIESIFIEFLNACLDDDSTEDSCWLWFYYINFYLNYVANIDELETDILKLLDSSSSDCYLAVTFYKALYRDEAKPTVALEKDAIVGTPLETMEKIYNLSELFDNDFLMRLLDRTLDLVPQTANLEALSNCLGVDGLSEKTRIKCTC